MLDLASERVPLVSPALPVGVSLPRATCLRRPLRRQKRGHMCPVLIADALAGAGLVGAPPVQIPRIRKLVYIHITAL